jgi:hypothetical protein
MKENKKLRKNLYILIFLNAALFAFAISYTVYFKETEGTGREISCIFKDTFGIYCPGCGGSRSLYYFLRLDFFRSFILYPPIIISALVVLDYDLRLSVSLIKKKTDITDRFKFYTFLLIPSSIMLTFIIRNLLLLVFKIDTVGDFI